LGLEVGRDSHREGKKKSKEKENVKVLGWSLQRGDMKKSQLHQQQTEAQLRRN